ncbi:hypothetical protein [Roseovarius aestuariivivens]|uniref:hypothetical protein n=1 Tax=Roseovarius aestuariivivens TaxID=1888910 RepID=UPI001081FFCA|nr:hypothetical protein [Roseovarius aestuariivivens]
MFFRQGLAALVAATVFAAPLGADQSTIWPDAPGCYFVDDRFICPAPNGSSQTRGIGGVTTADRPAGASGYQNYYPAYPPRPGQPAGNWSGYGWSETTAGADTAPAQRADGRATRIFAAPGAFPPEEFAAYAIVVFKSRVLPEDRLRRLNACKGYLAALMTPSEAAVPRDRQLVTVWPLTDQAAVEAIAAETDILGKCTHAVDHYGLALAQTALDHVELSVKVSAEDKARIREARGPFLFAWNPGTAKGQPDALILRVDMSDVVTAPRFRERFVAWGAEVEQRQDLWIDGWQEEDMWDLIGAWADRWGAPVMTMMGWGPDEG